MSMKLLVAAAAAVTLALAGCAAESPVPAATPAGVTDDFRGVALESAVAQFDEAHINYEVHVVTPEGVTVLQNPKDPAEQGKWRIYDLTDKDDTRIFAKDLNVGDSAVIIAEPWEGQKFPEESPAP
jgi:ABC-type glycerol-3-phosphate transport system substrate-binding protein